jgi:hypothetical protein
MALLTGADAKISLISSMTSSALSATEAMTEMSGDYANLRWYITAGAKRLLDPSHIPVVEYSTGGAFSTVPANLYKVLWGGGAVAFSAANGGLGTITTLRMTAAGYYFTYSNWANARSWKLNIEPSVTDITKLADAWKLRTVGIKSASCTITGFDEGTTWIWDDVARAGGYVGVELYEGTTNRWEAIGTIRSIGQGSKTGEISEITLEIDIVGEPNYATYAP